jgi:hypothetical protein
MIDMQNGTVEIDFRCPLIREQLHFSIFAKKRTAL